MTDDVTGIEVTQSATGIEVTQNAAASLAAIIETALHVADGDAFTVASGETIQRTTADIDGTLTVDGTLTLTG